MLNNSTLTFLKNLKKHNERTWFLEHKDDYQKARANFMDVFDTFTGEVVRLDHNFTDSVAESHIFRINRDVRFSNNKLPYKTHLSGYICPGGKNNMDLRACYYLHIEPGNSFLAGGSYMPEKSYLQKIRETIMQRGNELEELLEQAEFKKYFGNLSEDTKLKTAPRGYNKEHQYIELLRYKSFSSLSSLTDEEILSEDIIEIVMTRARALKPLCDWFNDIHV